MKIPSPAIGTAALLPNTIPSTAFLLTRLLSTKLLSTTFLSTKLLSTRLLSMTSLLTMTLLIILPSTPPATAADFELAGKIGAEARGFFEDASLPQQTHNGGVSAALEPTFDWAWNDGQDRFVFTPFFRLDQHDDERSHNDIRELNWTRSGDRWVFQAGLTKVFWGVTEFQHLVDTINQSDSVEDIDGEDKLGQPMLNLSLARDWGIVDLFVLPGFRERTFAGTDGRLRAGPEIDTGRSRYESGAEDQHVDLAIRWSRSIGYFDAGIHAFRGTNRDPRLIPEVVNGQTVLLPYYEQMTQLGLDLQATVDSWLWKLETLHRDTGEGSYRALQGGFEYTLYGIANSNADLGLLLEYGWDQRGERATGLFQNDMSAGARLALNDVSSTEMLAGFIHDLDHHSLSFQLEASRRFGSRWKLSLEARFFSARAAADPLHSLNRDDHLQLTLERYF